MAKEDSLIDKFKDVEQKIFDSLKLVELSIDYNSDRKTILAELKNYIKKVKAVENLLDEYEMIADKLKLVTGDEEKNQSATSAVVGLREDSEELKAEIATINNQVISTPVKKKKTIDKTREF